MNSKINDKLWENLPTAPIPNLEEMKIAASFERAWQEIAGYGHSSLKDVAELAYRRGRQDGKAVAMEEILGRKR